MSDTIDLALGVLDHQIVDSEDFRCGKVDDLELEGVREGSPRVEAILVGAPAWRGRGITGRLAAALVRGRLVRVPWSEVSKVDSAVRLRKPARELGLGRADDRARPLVAWMPGARNEG
jgi:sporulation protein YlmC with PRC-barrel domain